MILDARTVPAGTVLETDICIVGAGAAGITLAREFRDAPFRVVLLESGGMNYEPATEALYDGQSIGLPFQNLETCRLRYFGGTTNHWGGWCLPLDAIDFEKRPRFPYHGWPFGRAELDPFYRRAQEVCRIGPYDYRPADWGIEESEIPAPFAGPDFGCKILQVSAVQFGPAYAEELRRAGAVTVYLHANAFHFDGGETDAEIRLLSVKTLSGDDFTVRARLYVLATGGIENARLLLASGREGGNGIGNAHDLVGRFFMVHLVYSGGTIVPANPYTNFAFRSEGVRKLGEDGAPGAKHSFVSFVGLPDSCMRRLHLPGIEMLWSYRFSPVVDAVKAAQRVLGGEGPGDGLLTDISEMVRNFEGVADFAVRKALYGDGIPIEAMDLRCASEQQPNPESRITLGGARDRLGMSEVVVDWRLVAEDKSKAVETVRMLGAEMGRAGFGRLRSPLVEEDAWPADFYGNEHHMGTTRMHCDPKRGVVDENCRVHGVANLYVAGSSVFPTGGANNPTLTIVALALRLADHLRTRLV